MPKITIVPLSGESYELASWATFKKDISAIAKSAQKLGINLTVRLVPDWAETSTLLPARLVPRVSAKSPTRKKHGPGIPGTSRLDLHRLREAMRSPEFNQSAYGREIGEHPYLISYWVRKIRKEGKKKKR